MIKYDYTVTVTGNTAKLDKDIYLFRGNKNVHYYFAVKNASFNFKGATDLIEKTNAINAAVTVVKPNAVEVANAIAEVENGKIHLKVTEDLIDEEVEVGDFDLVFDLFDDTDGAVTIPKVTGQFHVLERPCTTPISELVATNTTNEVDLAVADYAIATYAEPVASTNADGTFAKKTWVAKEKITTAELNRMEEGIAYNNSQFKDIAKKIEQGGTGGDSTITSAWKGKKATFYGDSLTEENFQYTKGYHKWIQEILGLTSYENYGVSGYKISDVYNKVNSTTATGDIIFVMCGVNDETYSTPLGTMGDATTNTIYSSYDKLCSLLKSKYPTKIILFITPHYQTRYPHNDGITSYEVSKAMKEVCEKYAINVYDNYAISGIYPQNATNKSTFTTDGCHWNDLEHEIVGKNLANYVLNTYRYVYIGNSSETTTYTVTNNLANSTSSNSNTSINKGSSYNATITANTGYNISSIKVTMGGTDISSTSVSGNTITISNVTGNIIITVTTTATSTTTKYTITNTLTNCTNNNTATSVDENTSYIATITADSGYELSTVTITMDGTDITSNVYSDGSINISSVTGDIVIVGNANTIETSITLDDFTLVNIPDNSLSLENGTLSATNGSTDTSKPFSSAYLKSLNNISKITFKFPTSNDIIYCNRWIIYKISSDKIYFITCISNNLNDVGKLWEMEMINGNVSSTDKLSSTYTLTVEKETCIEYKENKLYIKNSDGNVVYTLDNSNTFGVVYSEGSGISPILENLTFFNI